MQHKGPLSPCVAEQEGYFNLFEDLQTYYKHIEDGYTFSKTKENGDVGI